MATTAAAAALTAASALKRKRKYRSREPAVLVDGSPATEVTDVEWRRIRLAGLAPSEKHPVTLLNRCASWTLIADCLKHDDVLQTTLREFAEGFDVNFALDAAVLEALCGTADNGDATVDLARTVSRQILGGTPTPHYLTEMYRRLLSWCVALGGAPVAYVSHRAAVAATVHGEEPRSLSTRRAAESAWRREEESFGRFERTSQFLKTEEFDEAVRSFASVNNVAARELRAKMRAAPRAAGMTALEYLKWHRDGSFPYVPPLETMKLTLLFDHRAKRLVGVDEQERVFREFVWLTQPPVTAGDDVQVPEESEFELRVRLTSPVLDCARDSKMYRHLKRQYLAAAYINSKRSVLVGPQQGLAQDYRTVKDGLLSKTNREEVRTSELLADYVQKLSEKYPNQIYQDLTRATRTAEETARMNMASYLSETGPGASFMSSATRPAGYVGTSEILETFEDFSKRRILADFRIMLDTFKQESHSYEAIKTFITSYCEGTLSQVREAYDNLMPSDKEAMNYFIRSSKMKLLAEQRKGADETLRELDELDALDRPDIHRIDSAGKLLGMYTTTVGVPDLEDLHCMWDTMWKSKLSGMSLYARRKNTLQYNNATPQVVGARATAALFCAVTNLAGFVVLVPINRTRFRDSANFTPNDLFVLDKFLKPTPTVRSLMAYHMSTLPTDVHVKPSEELVKLMVGNAETMLGAPAPASSGGGAAKNNKNKGGGKAGGVSGQNLLRKATQLTKEVSL